MFVNNEYVFIFEFLLVNVFFSLQQKRKIIEIFVRVCFYLFVMVSILQNEFKKILLTWQKWYFTSSVFFYFSSIIKFKYIMSYKWMVTNTLKVRSSLEDFLKMIFERNLQKNASILLIIVLYNWRTDADFITMHIAHYIIVTYVLLLTYLHLLSIDIRCKYLVYIVLLKRTPK